LPDLLLQHTASWFLLAAVAFIAGIVRGFSGFGGPAVMVLCLVPFYSPVSVLSKVAMIDLSANVKLLPSTWNEVNWHTTGWFIATAIVGIPVGMYALNTVDPTVMKRAMPVLRPAVPSLCLSADALPGCRHSG